LPKDANNLSIRKNIKFICFGLLLAALSGPGQTFYISFFSADIRAAFDLSIGGFNSFYSLATLASAALLVFTGSFIDTKPLRAYAVAAVGGVGVSCLFMSQISSLIALVFVFLALRHFGQGLCMHTASTSIARTFRANRGKALSLVQMGQPLSEMVFPSLAVALTLWFGWQQGWAVLGLGFIFIGVPVIVWLAGSEPRRITDDELDDQNSASRREILKDWRFYAILPFYMTSAMLLTVLFLNQQILAEERGWSVGALAAAFTFFAIMRVPASLLSGLCVDKFSARRLFPLTCVPFLLALLFLLFSRNITDGLFAYFIPYIYMGLIGMHVGTRVTMGGSLWPELYGTKHLGSIRALTYSVLVFSTAAGPVIAGLMLDKGWGYDSLLWASLIYVVLSLPFLLFALNRFPKTSILK